MFWRKKNLTVNYKDLVFCRNNIINALIDAHNNKFINIIIFFFLIKILYTIYYFIYLPYNIMEMLRNPSKNFSSVPLELILNGPSSYALSCGQSK